MSKTRNCTGARDRDHGQSAAVPQPPSGAIAVVALVCVAVASVLMAVAVRGVLGEARAARMELRRVQCQWLAESALDRAAARLAADRNYAGETWRISASVLTGKENREGAAVKIDVVAPPNEPLLRLIRVQADWPETPPMRARVSKQAVIALGGLR